GLANFRNALDRCWDRGTYRWRIASAAGELSAWALRENDGATVALAPVGCESGARPEKDPVAVRIAGALNPFPGFERAPGEAGRFGGPRAALELVSDLYLVGDPNDFRVTDANKSAAKMLAAGE